jgi:serine/threonine-protein kinase
VARGPGSRIGRYLIDRRLGSGGMADAYLAHQEGRAGFSKQVVIKVLHEQHARNASMVGCSCARRAWRAAQPPKTMQIFDLGEEDAEAVHRDGYVDGMTLLRPRGDAGRLAAA